MAMQPIKFYQTGTFTVGNRLLSEELRAVQADMARTNSLNSGHRACQGCGEALGARYAVDAAMRAADNQLIAVNATGCLEVFSTPYPETSWQIPWLHSLFGNAAAVATGVAAAMKVKGRKEVRVVAQGGDGALVFLVQAGGADDVHTGCLRDLGHELGVPCQVDGTGVEEGTQAERLQFMHAVDARLQDLAPLERRGRCVGVPAGPADEEVFVHERDAEIVGRTGTEDGVDRHERSSAELSTHWLIGSSKAMDQRLNQAIVNLCHAGSRNRRTHRGAPANVLPGR